MFDEMLTTVPWTTIAQSNSIFNVASNFIFNSEIFLYFDFPPRINSGISSFSFFNYTSLILESIDIMNGNNLREERKWFEFPCIIEAMVQQPKCFYRNKMKSRNFVIPLWSKMTKQFSRSKFIKKKKNPVGNIFN